MSLPGHHHEPLATVGKRGARLPIVLSVGLAAGSTAYAATRTYRLLMDRRWLKEQEALLPFPAKH